MSSPTRPVPFTSPSTAIDRRPRVTGGAAGFKHGQHLVMKPNTPCANLWLSLLRGAGLEVDSFGDSTGVIKEVFV